VYLVAVTAATLLVVALRVRRAFEGVFATGI